MSGKLDWRGALVLQHVREATRLGIDETLAACVTPAKALVRVKTRILQGSIQARPAVMDGHKIVGLWGSYGKTWGSFDVNYALWQEIKTFSRAGHRPYLRPAAEREYPKLAARIRRRLGK